MPTEAVYVDTRKSYNAVIEIGGLPKAYVRKHNVPEIEWAVSEHAHGGQQNTTKTPGKKKIGEITIEKAMPAMEDDTFFQTWFELCGKTPRAQHTKDVEFYDYDLSESAVRISGWRAVNAWPSKVTPGDRDAMSESDPVIETIILQCDDIIRI